jgi:peptidoglycan L-alanyl-D-glutamate endopeptidase CwlK
MTFVLSRRSRANLVGVHPRLVTLVECAIEITEQDFIVHEGLRSRAAQKRNIAKGVSWTLASRHLRQDDGYAHAVDLVPWIGGQPVWDWPGCYRIAAVMAAAAREQQTALIWGGVWDRPMSAYAGPAAAIKAACRDYVARRRAFGRRAAIDGPHFELVPAP